MVLGGMAGFADVLIDGTERYRGGVSTAPIQYITVSMTTDTAAYASGDLIADSQIVDIASAGNDVEAVLESVAIIDTDDQGVAMLVHFLSANVTMGTENAAPSISDGNALNHLGVVNVAAADWLDMGGARVATKANVGLVMRPVTGADDLYVAIINNTTAATFASGIITLRLGFRGQ